MKKRHMHADPLDVIKGVLAGELDPSLDEVRVELLPSLLFREGREQQEEKKMNNERRAQRRC